MRFPVFLLTLGATAGLVGPPAGAAVRIEAPDASGAVIDNVRSSLRLTNEPCDTPNSRIQRHFNRLEEDIRPALRAFGYYEPRIEKSLERAEACWEVAVRIDLGEPVRVRQQDIVIRGEAAQDPPFAELRDQLPLRPGEQLHHGRYEQIKSRLRTLGQQRGYFDAVFARHEMRVYPDAHAADIHVHFDSGRRYVFGPLRIGEHPLEDRLIEGLAAWEPGRPFDIQALFELDRRLSDAGYFQAVEVRPRREEAVGLAIPVDVELTAQPRHAWRAGIGYETDTGPRLRFGYENRFVNPSGHRLATELRLSPVDSGLTADYIVPGRDPRTETFDVKAALLHEETDTLTSNSAQIGVRQTLIRNGWKEFRFLEYLYEQSTVGQDETEAALLMPGIGWQRTFSDNPLRTSRGYRVSLEFRGAYEGVLSTTSLLQAIAGAKGIYRFPGAGRITGRAELGATAVEDISDLPASLRFFAGGDNSVRGYGYQRLGPRDEEGEPTGGKYLVTASLEYEHPVVGDDWWMGAFVDGGNAFNEQEFEPRFGYGVGLRWFSPVGRVRLDFAVPSDTFEDEWRIHFSLGADL